VAPHAAIGKGASAGDSQWTRELGRVGMNHMRAQHPL
jgi:hypothetical protein